MASITQNMRYRLSLIKFAQKYGVSMAARRFTFVQKTDDSCFSVIKTPSPFYLLSMQFLGHNSVSVFYHSEIY